VSAGCRPYATDAGYVAWVGSCLHTRLLLGDPSRSNLRPSLGCMSPQPHSVTLDPGEPRSRCIQPSGRSVRTMSGVVWMRRVCGMKAAAPPFKHDSRGRRGAHREASPASSCRRVSIHASARIAGIVVRLSRDPERNLHARARTAGFTVKAQFSQPMSDVAQDAGAAQRL